MATLTVKKRGKNFIIYNEGVVKIENVRFSFPHLDKPWAGKDPKPGQKEKFSIRGMCLKTTHQEVKDAIVDLMNEMLLAKKIAKLPPKDKFFRNGDDEKDVHYEGNWIISASEERRPTVRNRRGELITEPSEILNLIDGGYWGHILIRPWFQDNKHGQKINAGLVGVQHIRDDETFGEGRIDDTDAWAAEEGSDDGMGATATADADDGL